MMLLVPFKVFLFRMYTKGKITKNTRNNHLFFLLGKTILSFWNLLENSRRMALKQGGLDNFFSTFFPPRCRYMMPHEQAISDMKNDSLLIKYTCKINASTAIMSFIWIVHICGSSDNRMLYGLKSWDIQIRLSMEWRLNPQTKQATIGTHWYHF